MTRITIALACAGVFAASAAFAHHAPVSLGTVRIADSVMAGGVQLQPGMYEIRDTGEHLNALPGQTPEAMTWVEFVSNGRVVAREGAHITPTSEVAVGTAGTSSASRLRVTRLKGNDFVRISTNRDGERYLIYLPAR